ncbi:MAG: hypothetical protein ABRQ39_26440 [Candidatus Eremiobacterota bacterium]
MPVVNITEPAFDDISKLDKKTRERIYEAIEKLSRGIIRSDKLKGGKGYKVKSGKYRILWSYNEDGSIRIDRIKLRKVVYRNL